MIRCIIVFTLIFETVLSNESIRERRQTKRKFIVGAIFEEENSTHSIALRHGIAAANVLLAESKVFQDTELVHIVEVIRPGDSYGASTAACKLLKQGVVAIYGPTSLQTCHQVRSVCNRFQIPFIENHWGYFQPEGTYSINPHPSYITFGVAVWEYITQAEKWDTVCIIYMEEDGLLKFEYLLNQFDGSALTRQWVPTDGSYTELMQYLYDASVKNFIVDLPYWKIKDFLIMASAFNMTTQRYSYVFTKWDVQLVDLTPFQVDDGANLTCFSITPFITSSQTYGRGPMVEEFRKEIFKAEQLRKSFDIAELLPTIPALIYDSMILLAKGIIDTKILSPIPINCDDMTASWNYGLNIRNSITSLDPSKSSDYLTGEIRFDAESLRTDFNLTILDVTPIGYKRVGYWTKETGAIIDNPYIPMRKQKLPNLGNMTLRVTTIEEEPFVLVMKKDDNGNPLPDPEAWGGFCIDLLKRVAAEIQFNFTVHLVPDTTYGKYNETTKTWNGMIGEVISGRADLAVAPLTITYERELVIDFTTPYMSLGLTIMFKRPKADKPSIFSFLSPMSPEVWGYVAAAIVLVSVNLIVVARLSPYEWTSAEETDEEEVFENQYSIVNSFWFSIASLVQQGTEVNAKATSTRITSGIWWFFTLIIISTYTANLAAFLTVERNKLPIENAEDLSKQTTIKYGALRGGSTESFFTNSLIDTYKTMGQYMMANKESVMVSSSEEGVRYTREKNYAFILESTWNEYYTQQYCNLMQIGGLLDSKGYGIGLQQGSPYRDIISESILKLQKAQIIEVLKRKWFAKKNGSSENCMVSADAAGKQPQALGVGQVGGIFVVLLCGMALAFLVAILEFIMKARIDRKKGRVEYKGTSIYEEILPELKLAMRCMSSNKRIKRGAIERTNGNLPNNMSIATLNNTPMNDNVSNNRHMGRLLSDQSCVDSGLPPLSLDDEPLSDPYLIDTGFPPPGTWYIDAHGDHQEISSAIYPGDRYADQLPELRMKKLNC